jgi:predicted nuclease of predicted toxin-antitoxin system
VVAKSLKRRGVEVLTVVDANLLGAADKEHLEKARLEQRVIFTPEDDLLRLHTTGKEHAGIIYAHQGKATGELISKLMLIYHILEAKDLVNHVEYL